MQEPREGRVVVVNNYLEGCVTAIIARILLTLSSIAQRKRQEELLGLGWSSPKGLPETI